MELFEQLAEPYMLRALSAAILVGIVCGVLGCFVILRNMALIGDALSHAVLPGVVAAYAIAGFSLLAFFTGAVIAGVVTAILITIVHNYSKTKEDAAVGIIFTFMFSLGVIGITEINKQGVHLDVKDFLFGSVLGVGIEDIALILVVLLTILISVPLFYRQLFLSTLQPKTASTLGVNVKAVHYFLMILLSLTIVAALQTVGVILVVAMLIIPASTANLLTNRLHSLIIISGLFGVLSSTLGMLSAIMLDTSPGPAMTIAATFCYGLAFLFAPEKGLITRAIRIQRRKKSILLEDVLKQTANLKANQSLSIEYLAQRLAISTSKLNSILRTLQERNLIVKQKSTISLTAKGTAKAYQLIRAHRLVETYMEKNAGLNQDQVHFPAEQLEHLDSSIINNLDEALGYPNIDPHGSPIPKDKSEESIALIDLPSNLIGIVAFTQNSDELIPQLWKLGLNPNSVIQKVTVLDKNVIVTTEEKEIQLSYDIAKQVIIQTFSE